MPAFHVHFCRAQRSQSPIYLTVISPIQPQHGKKQRQQNAVFTFSAHAENSLGYPRFDDDHSVGAVAAECCWTKGL